MYIDYDVTELFISDANHMRTLDSSIKHNLAIIKKLKVINDEVKDGLIEELKTVNLSKFVSEAVSYICAAKLRSTDIQAAVQVCAVLTVPGSGLLSLISSQIYT